jgi:hypothetical protein
MPIILALRKLREEDLEFEDRLDYMRDSASKKNFFKKVLPHQVPVSHACNPSYRHRDWKD